MPGVVLGVLLIMLFNRPLTGAFYASTWIVLLAFAIRYIGIGWHAVHASAKRLSPDLADAARLEGVRGWQMFRHVVWPQIGSHLAIGAYMVFLLCLWDVETILLVYPPGGETLGLSIFNMLHYGHNAQVNALCLVILVVAAAPLLFGITFEALRSRFLDGARGIVSLGAIALPVLCVGCSPETKPNQAKLESEVFDYAEAFGTRGVGAGQLNKPRSVAVGPPDHLYAADMTGRVQKFTPDGKFVTSWQLPLTDLGKPKGMCRGNDGDILVLEPHYQRVNHYSPSGQLLAQWGRRGTGPGEFTLPRAVGVNSRGQIYVSEYTASERVQVFAPRGERFLFGFGKPGTGPGEFNRPEGLCIDSQDRVYVADSCNHRIQIFTAQGEFIRAYGKAGTGVGELSYPYDIAVDAAGRQYVCEFGNSRIQVFGADCQPLEIIGGPGSRPGEFNNPWSIALDSAGNLYVADSQNHRIQKLVSRPGPKAVGTPHSAAGWRSKGLNGLNKVCELLDLATLSPTFSFIGRLPNKVRHTVGDKVGDKVFVPTPGAKTQPCSSFNRFSLFNRFNSFN